MSYTRIVCTYNNDNNKKTPPKLHNRTLDRILSEKICLRDESYISYHTRVNQLILVRPSIRARITKDLTKGMYEKEKKN